MIAVVPEDLVDWVGRQQASVVSDGIGSIEMKDLETLQVTSTKVTGVGFEGLHHLDKLASLDLSHSSISDAGLTEIAGLKGLRHLTLIGIQARGPGLAELAKLKNLEDLTISKGQFPEKVIDDLRKALPKTKVNEF